MIGQDQGSSKMVDDNFLPNKRETENRRIAFFLSQKKTIAQEHRNRHPNRTQNLISNAPETSLKPPSRYVSMKSYLIPCIDYPTRNSHLSP